MAIDQDPTAKPQPPADVEGFMARPQEGAVMDGPATPDAQTTNGTEATHAPEEPGVFSSSETTADAHTSYDTAIDGPVIAPEVHKDHVRDHVSPIAAAAEAYLQKLADEKGDPTNIPEDTLKTTSTELVPVGEAKDVPIPEQADSTTRPKHPATAPTTIVASSDETIALPQRSEQLNWKPKAEDTGLAHGPEAPVKAEPPADRTEENVAPPKKSRKGLFGGLVAGVAGLAAVAGLAVAKGSSDTTTPEKVNPNPVPPAGAEAYESPTEPAATTEHPTVKDTTVHTQPPEHLGVSDSLRGSYPRDYLDEEVMGDFFIGISLKDLETMGFDASNLVEGKKGVYSIPDKDRTVIVGVNDKSGKIDAIHIESRDAKTRAGVHVGSTEAEVKKAYGSDLQEQKFTVDDKTLKVLILEDDTHKDVGAQTMFTLDDEGNVASIDVRNVIDSKTGERNSRASTGPLVVPLSIA